MKLAVHIPFYSDPNRVAYLHQVLKSLDGIEANVDVFVYTNRKNWSIPVLANARLVIRNFWCLSRKGPRSRKDYRQPYHRVPRRLRYYLDPFFLTWRNRDYIEKDLESYDAQMYLEDDLDFNQDTFQYWLQNRELCNRHDFNLGFLRKELDASSSRWFYSDLDRAPENIITLQGRPFLLNDVNSYTGFWIYDRDILREFVKTPIWRFEFGKYGVREKSAIGWHGIGSTRFKGTVFPLEVSDNSSLRVPGGCHVHHLPNNYIGHKKFCRVEIPLNVES